MHALYGKWDRKVGHWRRYSRWRLRQVLEAAGLREVEMRYMNMLSIPHGGFLALRRRPEHGGKMTLWDDSGIRLGRRLESIFPAPIGLNLFCVARPLRS